MTVAIIGGGASGLAAAITSAEDGNNVLLFERQARVGKKLLATGNGRCNLSNTNVGIKNYHGAEPEFVKKALELYGPKDTIRFFLELGLVTTVQEDGKVYPFSDQAGSVLDVLRFAADERGVKAFTGVEVYSVKRNGDGFKIKAGEDIFYADKVIVCCGGAAGGKLGGTKSGYALLKSLGHTVTEIYPSLVQLKTDNTYVRSLKGVRAEGKVTLTKNGEVIAESAGEIQFTDYGVSGPAAFEVSRAASIGGEGITVSLDLMPGMSEEDICDYMLKKRHNYADLTLENILTGMLHNRLGRTLVRYAGLDLNTPLGKTTEKEISEIAAAVKNLSLPVIGNMGFENAQVTAGGVKTSEFNPDTLESKLVPGLYAAGEVLDIDGDCGGYNLQWAWASGRLAGRLL